MRRLAVAVLLSLAAVPVSAAALEERLAACLVCKNLAHFLAHLR